MDFAPPADWCPEDAEDIEATRAVYDALAVLLAEGHKVDVMDIGANAPPEAITTLDVSLSEVDRDAFRFFENHKFNLSLKEESCKVNSFLRITTALARKIRESCKLLSILGIGVAVSCLWVATRLYPGGYDWSRGMISTLLRGPAGPARILAIVGVLFFCVSIALVFERLAHAVEFSKNSTVIRIGGIGSMVYASLTFTPIHDLMVTISLIFFLVAAFTITQALYVSREIGFFVAQPQTNVIDICERYANASGAA